MANEKESFVFYRSFYEAIKNLDEKDQLGLYNAICEYSLEGKLTSELEGVIRAMFTLIKPNIDSTNAKYKASVENGKKGGRPKKNSDNKKDKKNLGKPNNNPKENKGKAKVNLNVDVDVDVDVNEDVNDNEDKKESIKKKTLGEFKKVKLTEDEINKLKEEYPKHFEVIIKQLDDYKKMTGKTYKEDYLAIRNWVIKSCIEKGLIDEFDIEPKKPSKSKQQQEQQEMSEEELKEVKKKLSNLYK